MTVHKRVLCTPLLEGTTKLGCPALKLRGVKLLGVTSTHCGVKTLTYCGVKAVWSGVTVCRVKHSFGVKYIFGMKVTLHASGVTRLYSECPFAVCEVKFKFLIAFRFCNQMHVCYALFSFYTLKCYIAQSILSNCTCWIVSVTNVRESLDQFLPM